LHAARMPVFGNGLPALAGRLRLVVGCPPMPTLLSLLLPALPVLLVGLACLAVPGWRKVGAFYLLGTASALALRWWVFGLSH
jgi:hypothetical protein